MLCSVMGFAKEDVSSIVIDFDNPVGISVAIRSTFVGNVAVKGQTKLLGAYVYNNTGSDVNMDIRWAAFQGGRVREIYDGYGYKELAANSATNIKVPCLIDVPAGEYSFYPIVRFSGDSKWYLCSYAAFELDEEYTKAWKLTVLDSYNAPSCSYTANLDWGGSEPDACDIVYQYKLNEPFRVQTDLINNTDHVLNGKVKLVYQRSLEMYWRGDSYLDTDIKDEWMDCITYKAIINGLHADANGCFHISLQPGETQSLVYENCMGTIYREDGGRWAPRMATYYLADGLEDIPENWKFVNESMWYCFDTDHNLVSFYDGGVNTQSIEFFPESSSSESISSTNIKLKYINGQAIVTGLQSGQEVSIISISGKLITSKISESDNVSISLAGVPDGTFIAVVRAKERVIYTTKFINLKNS